jgi:hypothetical protein
LRSTTDIHPPAQLCHVSFEYGRTGSVVHELPILPGLDQTSARELLQMMRDRGLADGKTSAQGTTAHLRLFRDVLENLEPSRIGQRFRDALKLLGVHRITARSASYDT